MGPLGSFESSGAVLRLFRSDENPVSGRVVWFDTNFFYPSWEFNTCQRSHLLHLHEIFSNWMTCKKILPTKSRTHEYRTLDVGILRCTISILPFLSRNLYSFQLVQGSWRLISRFIINLLIGKNDIRFACWYGTLQECILAVCGSRYRI